MSSFRRHTLGKHGGFIEGAKEIYWNNYADEVESVEKLEQLSMEQKKLQGLLEIMNTMDKVYTNIIEDKDVEWMYLAKEVEVI